MSKKILAVLLCLAMVCAFAACGAKEEPETTEPETEVTEEATEATEATEEATEATEEATEATEEATEATEAAETTEEATSETKADESTEAETKEEAKVPATKAEVLKVYNDAINGAISAKAGYDKKRVCTINTLEGGAILKISVAKEAVYNFLGVGEKTFANAKGKAEFMGKASLTEADVTDAKCELKDGKYVVTISVKDGASKANASGNSETSPLSKTGLFTGEGDKSEYDYKNAGNIHYALNNTDGAALEQAELKATKGKIKATIDPESGKLSDLEISFNFAVVLTNVKYTIATIKQGTGDADTVVNFTNFKY